MELLGLILKAAVAVVQFPDAMSRLLKILQSTDQQRHEELLQAMEKEATSFAQGGRPQW